MNFLSVNLIAFILMSMFCCVQVNDSEKDSPSDVIIETGLPKIFLTGNNTNKETDGGTSAGMAIHSEFSYTGEMGSVNSAESLMNPFNNKVTVGKSFIELPLLRNFVTDTHFSQRNRLGRLAVFMARIVKDCGILPKAIACDEYTAVCIDNTGEASIYGQNAFFIEPLDPTSYNCNANDLEWNYMNIVNGIIEEL